MCWFERVPVNCIDTCSITASIGVVASTWGITTGSTAAVNVVIESVFAPFRSSIAKPYLTNLNKTNYNLMKSKNEKVNDSMVVLESCCH